MFYVCCFSFKEQPSFKAHKGGPAVQCKPTMYCPLAMFLFSGFYTLVYKNEERYLVICLICGFWIGDKYKAIFNGSQTMVLSV